MTPLPAGGVAPPVSGASGVGLSEANPLMIPWCATPTLVDQRLILPHTSIPTALIRILLCTRVKVPSSWNATIFVSDKSQPLGLVIGTHTVDGASRLYSLWSWPERSRALML